MYNILVLIFSLIVPVFIVIKDIDKGKNIKGFIKKNKLILIVYMSFVIGFITRLICIANFPNGLNVDEASSGYEAFSIMNYGIDRSGNFLPIFLEAWGSGQNAFYTYLLIPFIKILGLNILTTRLPMAIIGCISLVVMYKILDKITTKKIATIGIIFFAITPWHIMKSRWGLESNIFPDIILYAIFFIIKYLDKKEIKQLYIASVFLGLSAYSYGTSYFFLSIFVVLLLIYLFIKKEITLKYCIEVICIIFLISVPIILFLIINTFNLEPINLIFTIPRLQENRYEEITSIFSKYFFSKSISNFINALKILIKQDDGLGWNAMPIYGLTYIISLPFMLVGIYNNFKTKDKSRWILNLWFFTSILLMFVVEPNINRLNIIIIPIIYYTIIGISVVYDKIQLSKIFLPIIYISLFISFEISYFTTDWNSFNTFNNHVENVIKYVEQTDSEKIYFEYSFKEPYIYVCFYNKINTQEFVNTVKYKNNIKTFDSVQSFCRYNFYIPENIEENGIYVISIDNEKKYDFKDEIWNKYYIDDFVVFSKK